MALRLMPLTWGCIVSLVLLGCIAGCSRHPAPVPPPPLPQVREKTAPTGPPTVIQIGTASWYGPGFHGHETASGETFNQHALTAAHRTLPLGTEAKVTNLATGQSVLVKINDRGPYVKGRHLDLSRAAAKQIGLTKRGVAKVKIEAKTTRRAKRHALHRDAANRGWHDT
jgi:peptidoglycan lytic transglycosylase